MAAHRVGRGTRDGAFRWGAGTIPRGTRVGADRVNTLSVGVLGSARRTGNRADAALRSALQETQRLIADSPPGIEAVPHDDNLRCMPAQLLILDIRPS